MKVMTIVGTRPEIIKLSRVIHELDNNTNHILVHSGQNYDYELNEIFFKQLNIRKPNYFLNIPNNNPSEAIGNIIIKSDMIIKKEKPNAILIYGDTNTGLSVISAKRNNIPIFHMEAGNRCFDERVPEELNRKIIDHLSDVNMTLTEHARRYLVNEGKNPKLVIKIGSTMYEVINFYFDKIKKSNIINTLNLTPKKFFLVSAHREENIDSTMNFENLLKSLNEIAKKYDMPLIVSTHPRTKKKLYEFNHINIDKKIRFIKPLGFTDYVKLQMHAYCIISDSGTLTEEASILNLPAIMIRQAHERPEGMDQGTLIMSGLEPKRILESIDIIIKQHSSSDKRLFNILPDYNQKNVSKKVVRIIMSYTDYINRTVWYKS